MDEGSISINYYQYSITYFTNLLEQFATQGLLAKQFALTYITKKDIPRGILTSPYL